MRFYHYTTRYAVDGIKSVLVLKGSPQGGLVSGAVSLTTDPTSNGHGLPDGRRTGPTTLPQVQTQIINGVRHCFDHTECRVVLEIDQGDPDLVAFSTIVTDPREVWALDLAGWHPIDDLNLIIPQAQQTVAKLKSGTLQRKSGTWWFYKANISIDRIVAFETKDGLGQYVPMP